MPRELRAGQRAELHTIDVVTGETTLLFSSRDLLFEAPNWTSDGAWLIVNGAGGLFRISASAGASGSGAAELIPIDLGTIPPINNDHVLSPDDSTAYVSSEDGHLYAVPLGGGQIRRVSNDRGAFTYYLHGVSHDGVTLAYIGMERHGDGTVRTNVYTIPSAGGSDEHVTNDEFADDGSEFSRDGRWIYFNSERASNDAGHAQLFRIARNGSQLEQLTFDERVNWFPHLSPSGRTIAYVSFPSGTMGHPADVNVIVRLLDLDEPVDQLVERRDTFGYDGRHGQSCSPSLPSAVPSLSRRTFASSRMTLAGNSLPLSKILFNW